MRDTNKVLTNEEYNILEKIASNTKMDCWFSIEQDDNEEDYVYDLEENKKLSLYDGLSQLVEGIDCVENYDSCNLTDEEKLTFEHLLYRLDIEFEMSSL